MKRDDDNRSNRNKAGEIFSADVYAGSFIVGDDRRSIVVINDKEYEFTGDIIKYQEVVPNKKGERELKLHYKREKKYSNDFEYEGSSTFYYEIK